MMLDAGRERREMASKMTRELFRLREVLREAVEQQQMVISRLVDTVSTRVPAPADTAQGEGNEELRARQEELIKKLLDAESKSALKAEQTNGWIWMALPSIRVGMKAWMPKRCRVGARLSNTGRS